MRTMQCHFSWTYNIGFPFLLCHIYFLYIVGSSFAMCSANVPSSIMCTISFMSTCRNAPGISFMMTYLPALASMLNGIISTSSDTVGQLLSSFCVFLLWYYVHTSSCLYCYNYFFFNEHQISQPFLSVFTCEFIFFLWHHCLSFVKLLQFFHEVNFWNFYSRFHTHLCHHDVCMWFWVFHIIVDQPVVYSIVPTA